MAEVIYLSKLAVITTELVRIQEYEYSVNDIEEVSLYEGRESMMGAVGYLWGRLGRSLASVVLPSNFDSGLVVATRHGKSDIIQGLEVAEAKRIIDALKTVFKTDQPAAVEPAAVDDKPKNQELVNGQKVVEEGTYQGRKWRRLENGVLECQLLGGRFKEFSSLEEFGEYIS